MMLRFFLLGLLVVGSFSFAEAQSYSTTLGLRLGDNSVARSVGITGKQRLAKHLTIEGIAQTDFRHNHTVHGLAEYHRPLLSRRLNGYIGAGASAGREQSTIFDKENQRYITSLKNPTVGVDLIAGVEITLLKVNVSIDYKPNFNLYGREKWILGQTGISARYVLVSGAKKRQNYRKKKRKAFFERIGIKK